jgi:hypothetical protein
MVNRETLKEILLIATSTSEQKKMDDMFENKDAIVIMVLLGMMEIKNELDFFKVGEIKENIKELIGVEKTDRKTGKSFLDVPDWVNVKTIGRSLKRMNLIKDKKRDHTGVEVMLSFEKVRKKAEGYRLTPIKKKEEPQHLVQSKLDAKEDEI